MRPSTGSGHQCLGILWPPHESSQCRVRLVAKYCTVSRPRGRLGWLNNSLGGFAASDACDNVIAKLLAAQNSNESGHHVHSRTTTWTTRQFAIETKSLRCSFRFFVPASLSKICYASRFPRTQRLSPKICRGQMRRSRFISSPHSSRSGLHAKMRLSDANVGDGEDASAYPTVADGNLTQESTIAGSYKYQLMLQLILPWTIVRY